MNVAVVPMHEETVHHGQTVIVRGERIESIGPSETQPVPAAATVIDGAGRYLTPGLADLHVHVWVPFDNGPLFLEAGVTTVLNLGTLVNADEILPERDRSHDPGFVGPTLYTSGRLIHSRHGDDPAEVERIVRVTAEGGYDVVKIYGDVTPEAFARLHETARALGIKVIGHAQRKRGMQPVYDEKQDLAHVEEYLYAAFNPDTPGFARAALGAAIALVLLTLLTSGWAAGAVWRRLRGGGPAASPSTLTARRTTGALTVLAWLVLVALWLTLTPPFTGLFAGRTPALWAVAALTVGAAVAVVLLTSRAWTAWRHPEATRRRVSLLLAVGLAWVFVACIGFLVPRCWRTTDGGLDRVARETAAAGIWVTPNLVAWDYITRQSGDEFHTLVQRPELQYLRPATRDRWINRNPYRVPAPIASMSHLARQRYGELMTRLTGKLHEAGVPLLAGSDGGGVPGLMPGATLLEELSLLVDAGLTPYEALRTATVNAAVYLDAEQEFGRIAPGLRADLVLLAGNPLEDIGHLRTRIGVMKRGRWYSAEELESELTRLAHQRQ